MITSNASQNARTTHAVFLSSPIFMNGADTLQKQQAGRTFLKLTQWQQCQLTCVNFLPVTSAPQHLENYITQQNITSIAVFGDSQGQRYGKALIEIFYRASFLCYPEKKEPTGYHIHLDYYTKGTGFPTNATVSRACHGCNSFLQICSSDKGHKVDVEYISMMLTSQETLPLRHPACKQNKYHPLCQNITQPEFVFKYYLNRTKHYPQLLMIFSAFAHDREKPLEEVYDGLINLLKLITTYAPPTSTVIWYAAPPWHTKNHTNWFTSEGEGYNPNDKMQETKPFSF